MWKLIKKTETYEIYESDMNNDTKDYIILQSKMNIQQNLSDNKKKDNDKEQK